MTSISFNSLKKFSHKPSVAISSFELADGPPETCHNLREHPLVLSCAMHRLYIENKRHVTFTIEHFPKDVEILDSDRTLANTIADYYRKKLLFARLRSDEMSKFRLDLLTLLAYDFAPNSYPESLFGMAWKLPYFYNNDLCLENEIFKTTRFSIKPLKDAREKTPKKLKFIKRIDKTHKSSQYDYYSYWFTDELDNRVEVAFRKGDGLIHLWEKVIQDGIILKTGFAVKKYDDLEFYHSPYGAWKLLLGEENE